MVILMNQYDNPEFFSEYAKIVNVNEYLSQVLANI